MCGCVIFAMEKVFGLNRVFGGGGSGDFDIFGILLDGDALADAGIYG